LADTIITEPLPSSVDVAASRRRGLIFLAIAAAMVSFTLSLQTGLNSNFVVDVMHLSGGQQGMLEAVRESCGIIALLVLVLLAGLSEPRIGAIMLVLLSIGITAYAVVPTYGYLLVASFVWSQGFHVWVPLPQSMAISLADKGREGRTLGILGSAGAIASTLALITAWLLTWSGVPIRPLWFIAGFATLLGAAACIAIPRDIKAPGQKLVIRREYGLFYLLQFLEGWRKQIFIAFAGYMLVKIYHTPVSTMLLLFLASNIAGWFTSPLVGRIIDKVGERRVLQFYYCSTAIVFVLYAQVQTAWPLYFLFAMDSILFVCTMALTTYVSRIAPAEERTATLSAGVAANHVASVTMPLVGGLLWEGVGYRWTFLAGAAMAVTTLVIVSFMRDRPEQVRSAEDVTVA
jgi:predicted MFS family arabinose efflux permease